jgi:hypothetical protein
MSMITTHNHHDAAIWICWFKLVVPLVYKWVKRSFQAWFAKCVIWMILIFLNVIWECVARVMSKWIMIVVLIWTIKGS